MMIRLAPLASLAVLAAAAGCAPVSPGGEARAASEAQALRCFYPDQVRGFRSSNGADIYFDAGRDRVFHARVGGVCQDLDFALALAIHPESKGSARLCAGDWARLNVRGSRVTAPCRVRIVKALTEAEIAALPDRDRP